MNVNWYSGLLYFLKSTSQILSAGIAITAFSLLLYALTFNLRDRVARTFALIMFCVLMVFSGEAIGNTVIPLWEVALFLKLEWIGIVLLPATYLHFSDSLLATTGKPSRGRRAWAVRLTYLASFLFLLALPLGILVGPLALDESSAPHLLPTSASTVFTLFYILIMILAWMNLIRALRRTTTPTSRRRLYFLLFGAAAPMIGVFPFLLYTSDLAREHALIYWSIALITNILVGFLVIIMAYSAAFFGVTWPDRVVKSRLFKWLMRGPVTASITLALATLVRRSGAVFGVEYSTIVPIVTVGTILICEFMITLFSPLGERFLFYGNDRVEIELLRNLENRLLTRNDLGQFLEMVLAAVRDRLQAKGVYIAALNGTGLELVMTTGEVPKLEKENKANELLEMVSEREGFPDIFQWDEDLLLPLMEDSSAKDCHLLGVMGVSSVQLNLLDPEQVIALQLLGEKAALALRDRHIQQQIFQNLQSISPDMEMLQRMRAAGQYDGSKVIAGDYPAETPDIAHWVKEALTHYWGGPKLTESPLLKLKIVRDALTAHEGNYPNALRSILKDAIERTKPEGERRFTAEWILYNILELKFLEGRKVREVALRLAMSEADLYRKQRVALETVAQTLLQMEHEALQVMDDAGMVQMAD